MGNGGAVTTAAAVGEGKNGGMPITSLGPSLTTGGSGGGAQYSMLRHSTGGGPFYSMDDDNGPAVTMAPKMNAGILGGSLSMSSNGVPTTASGGGGGGSAGNGGGGGGGSAGMHLFRTKPCRFYFEERYCRKGSHCNFSHDINVWKKFKAEQEALAAGGAGISAAAPGGAAAAAAAGAVAGSLGGNGQVLGINGGVGMTGAMTSGDGGEGNGREEYQSGGYSGGAFMHYRQQQQQQQQHYQLNQNEFPPLRNIK